MSEPAGNRPPFDLRLLRKTVEGRPDYAEAQAELERIQADIEPLENARSAVHNRQDRIWDEEAARLFGSGAPS